ncbi:MAG TPA: serine hydrolase domain-containing protein, partial [Thermomicrobiales bacterium]|nr:serine hydrolase domain-containing protein [Thermomicrobiales bacterium]
MTKGGFSEARLGRLHDALARHVESGAMPGLVALVWRRGETHVETIGVQSFDNDAPMRRDTIFRIASMTKPIVAAAAMSLVEECRIRLDDPVDDLLPELANRRVLRTLASEIDDVVPANRSITLRDLLTFRLGYGAIMAFPPQYPIQHAMEQAGVAPGPQGPSLPPDALMAAYGSLPLVHQPGE